MATPRAVRVARGAAGASTVGAEPIFKIHPSIGIARLGDAAAFFLGPEQPFGGNTGQADGKGSAVPPFRAGGKIKRQAARFRVFHYPPGQPPKEVNSVDDPNIVEIQWTVQLANKKAAFFRFEGQRGVSGPYGAGRPGVRNPGVTGAARQTQLVIDPGPKPIKGLSAGPVKFDSTSGNWPKNTAGAPVLSFLGELQTDAKGRLLVLGGNGTSVSSDALLPSAGQMTELKARGFRGPASGTGRPSAPLLEYANNDTWFDDICDGPVTAKVKLKSGKTVTVQSPAWVLVGPPDFAPEIRNVISLYDTMLDVAIRELPDPPAIFYPGFDRANFMDIKASFHGGPAFEPEFFVDIDPTISAGLSARYVHNNANVPSSGSTFHDTLTKADLKDPTAAAKPTRDFVFLMLRPPAGNANYVGAGSMPKLNGDDYFDARSPKRVAAVTQVQYHILNQWKDGHFIVGSGGPTGSVTPEGLDRATLESCVGGAFFPGIECSWLVRQKEIYAEPFRIKHGAVVGSLTVGPGFFSQQMALPWQADFADCRKDDGLGTMLGWWPAQRPDDVYLNPASAAVGNPTVMVDWGRGVLTIPPPPAPGPALPPDLRAGAATHEKMVSVWNQLGFVVSSPGAAGNKVFSEQERTLP
jgi:hypothetical protein